MWSAMEQPTTLRLKQSSTVARERNSPPASGRYVMSPMYVRPGSVAVKSRWNRSGTGEAAGSGTVVHTCPRRRMAVMEDVRMIRAIRFSLTRRLFSRSSA